MEMPAMIPWMSIIDLGHTAVMIPAAGAVLVWLIVGRAWKLALWWSLILAVGLSVVAWSKMAFLGWGLEIRPIGFQALSGHAWRATAILPVLFFVVLDRAPFAWRIRGALFGGALGTALGVLLVIFTFHTVSEVIASSLLGCAAAFVMIRLATTSPPPRITPWAAPVTMLAFVAIAGLKPSSLNHRLVDVALYVSGRDEPYRWSRQIDSSASQAGDRKTLKTCEARIVR